MQALFMNLMPPSFRIFFNSGPKKALSLSLDVKCDQQTHKKNDASNYGINLKKIIQQSPITILPMFLVEEFLHKIEAVFAGFDSPAIRLRIFFCLIRGGFYGFGLWEVKMLWVQVMGEALVYICVTTHK
jgi:hypothetical protein